jgi:hypothetical protein
MGDGQERRVSEIRGCHKHGQEKASTSISIDVWSQHHLLLSHSLLPLSFDAFVLQQQRVSAVSERRLT